MDSTAEHKGLSEFGYRPVKEMNRLGMIIDVSHVSSEALYDILKVSSLPVIASHSGAYSLKNHRRNLTVELLKRGYTHRDLELFWGGNLIRILKIHFM